MKDPGVVIVGDGLAAQRAADLHSALPHAAKPPVAPIRPKVSINGEADTVVTHGQLHHARAERQSYAQPRGVRVSYCVRDRLTRHAQDHLRGLRIERSWRSVGNELQI